MLTVLSQRAMKYSAKYLNDQVLKHIDRQPRFQYFAFGANMDPELLRKKKIYPRSSRKCQLKDYQIKIDMPCEFKNKGFATVSKRKASTVWGVVHDISLAEMLYIDILEWVPFSMHERVSGEVFLQGRKNPIKAWFYIAQTPTAKLKTSERYRDMLVTAAEKYKFPKAYIDKLRKLPVAKTFAHDPGFRLSNPRKRRLFEHELSGLYLYHDKLREKLCQLI